MSLCKSSLFYSCYAIWYLIKPNLVLLVLLGGHHCFPHLKTCLHHSVCIMENKFPLFRTYYTFTYHFTLLALSFVPRRLADAGSDFWNLGANGGSYWGCSIKDKFPDQKGKASHLPLVKLFAEEPLIYELPSIFGLRKRQTWGFIVDLDIHGPRSFMANSVWVK